MHVRRDLPSFYALGLCFQRLTRSNMRFPDHAPLTVLQQMSDATNRISAVPLFFTLKLTLLLSARPTPFGILAISSA
jgi:hypothetical protein